MSDSVSNKRPFFDSKPPSRDELQIDIVAPRPGEKLELVILSTRSIGVWTHWVDRRTRPCFGEGCPCRTDKRAVPRRWKAFLGCWKPVPGRMVIASITSNAARECPILVDPCTDLRGWRLWLWRRNAAVNAPVLAQVKPQEPTVVLPQEFNVVKQLYKIWGLDFWEYEEAREKGLIDHGWVPSTPGNEDNGE